MFFASKARIGVNLSVNTCRKVQVKKYVRNVTEILKDGDITVSLNRRTQTIGIAQTLILDKAIVLEIISC